jgi:diguanylate cyclase (GGDEF)-like protein
MGSRTGVDLERVMGELLPIVYTFGYSYRVFGESMNQKGLLTIKFGGIPAQTVQAGMRRIERRQWCLWSYTVLVTILLTLGIASFAFPALLSQTGEAHSFSINQAVHGLVGLVLVFNVYVIYQQVQLNRIRRQMTEQAFSVDKVETLAEEVYKVAVLDSLTGLYNRPYSRQRLQDEIARSQRHSLPLTVILFDLNSFKPVNDNYGHDAGDKMLISFAERLRKATRGSDVAARYGGDEFLVLLPECKTGDVQYVLKRVDGTQADIGGEMLKITYSAGWADYIPGESPEELLGRADKALYVNKRIAKGQDNRSVVSA